MSETTARIEAAMEKYAPEGFDPASDDMTIQFAIQLVEKDRENAKLRKALEVCLGHLTGGLDGNYADCDPREVAREALRSSDRHS